MKKHLSVMLAIAMSAALLTACGDKEDPSQTPDVPEYAQPIETGTTEPEASAEPAAEEETEPEEEPEETREGYYRSELTHEWIDESLRYQRPVAIMVDNEKTALDHYGVNSADIVYEMVNSTLNGRITRLMCIVKDWEQIQQFGSIRSTRPTNIILSWEYNAILIHDGGPGVHIDPYLGKAFTNNLSGGFARYDNGKSQEFTEYVTAQSYSGPKGTFDGLITRIAKAGYSTDFNEYNPGAKFHFARNDEVLTLDGEENVISATSVDLSQAFPHNASRLDYNASTGLYEYSEYGAKHIDALTGETTAFTNVILQKADLAELDSNGYMIYFIWSNHYTDNREEGYYLTGGQAIPIYWVKHGDPDTLRVTQYYNAATGEEIRLNTGKTYIAICPADTWDEVSIQ